MRIGIDVSQIVYEGTGVARYVRELVPRVIRAGTQHTFVLFAASLRRREVFDAFYSSLPDHTRVILRVFPVPPILLDFLWNRLHMLPVEWFIGPVDVFWSSDWTQPPLSRARGITTIHDMIVYTHPEETHASTDLDAQTINVRANIVATQKRRLSWVKRECDRILCDSDATKKDVMKYLSIQEQKLEVVYPGNS